jgi:hypothetical protein
MRIVCSDRGPEKVWEVAETDFVLGRAHGNSRLRPDLSPDEEMSHVHVWKVDGVSWIEGYQSAHETLLNTVEIRGEGRQKLQVGDLIVAGETTLRVESLECREVLVQTNHLEVGASLLLAEQQTDVGVNIARDLDATDFDPAPAKGSGDTGALRLNLVQIEQTTRRSTKGISSPIV